MDTVKSTLKNIRNSSKAALDLGTVMIAVVVLGIIAAVTAATVFVVIPWMQDSSAKQALSSISSAQESYKTAYDVYSNLNNLIEKKLLNADARLCTTASADGTSYTSASKSDTGKVFISDSSDRNPRQAAAGTSTCFGVLGTGGVFTPNPTNTQNPGTTPPPNSKVPKPPATPNIKAAWNGTTKQATGSMVNSPYCEAGSVLEYRWKSVSTNTTTPGTWSSFSIWSTTSSLSVTANYGTKYDFQAELRCRNTTTNVTSDTQASNTASVITPIPAPSKPTVTATEISATQTKWDWTATCATGAPVYSYGDWRDGASTVNNAVTYSSETTATSRTRDTSKQGYNYSVNVKAKCKSSIATSDWSDSNDAKWLRNIAAPDAPGMNASVSDTGTQEYANLSWGSSSTCGPGTSVRFFWSIARERYLWESGETTGKTGASNAYDGFTYTWAAKAKCVNTDSNRESAWSGTSSVVREVAVRPPNFRGWNIYRSGSNVIYMVPLVSCRSFVVRIGDMTPGSWSWPNVWIYGPKTGQLGWYTDNGWAFSGLRDSNGNFYTGSQNPRGNYAAGSVFSAKGSFYCYNEFSGKYSSRVDNDSGGWAAP